MAITTALDHLVYVVPDLDAGVARFAEATGVQPVYGGAHVGLGTANYLVGLHPAGWADEPTPLTYLEILGPDPEQEIGADVVRPLEVDRVDAARLQTWAIHPQGFDGVLERAAASGVDVGEVRAMSRRTPEGDLLEWRLTMRAQLPFAGLQPFLIDWGSSPHPATRELPVLGLESLTLTHPDAGGLQAALAALGADGTDVEQGVERQMAAVLQTPRGTVEI